LLLYYSQLKCDFTLFLYSQYTSSFVQAQLHIFTLYTNTHTHYTQPYTHYNIIMYTHMRSNSITLLESFSHINTIARRARAHTHINTRATFHCHKLVFLHNYTLSDTSRHVKKKNSNNNNNTSLFINNIPPSTTQPHRFKNLRCRNNRITQI